MRVFFIGYVIMVNGKNLARQQIHFPIGEKLFSPKRRLKQDS